MKTDLMAQGIPEERIHLDYAGFRTLDSMVRCKEIFGQNKVTVISQHYHNERAIYIAHKKGIDAIGFNAIDVGGSYGIKNHTREKLARVKMILDLLLNKQPKYLGEKIKI
jgi:SanA protein